MGVIAYCNDGVEIAANEVVGWQKELCDDLALRAAVYPALAIFNPLGVLGKTLLVAKSSELSLVMTCLSLIGTMCLAFFFIGLRRRFKLE
jgi:hypothetical protein